MTLRHVLNVLALMLSIFVCFSARAQAPEVSAPSGQPQAPQTPAPDFTIGIFRPEVHNSIEIDEINQREYALSMFRAAAKAVNLTFDVFTYIPDNDEVAGLKSGRMQFVGPVPVVEGRLKHMDMTEPILIAKGAAFYRTGSPRLANSEQLKGKRVGVAMWGAGHQWCLERQVAVMARESLNEALQELKDGKVDYVITTEIAGSMAIENQKLTGIRHAVLEDGKVLRAYAFAALPENDALRKKIDEGLRLIKNSGEADMLYDKYVAPYQARDRGSAVSLTVAAWVGGLLLAASAAGAMAYATTRNRLKRRSAALLESQEHYRLMTENLSGVTYRYLEHESGKRVMLSANSLFPIWQEVFPEFKLENVFGEGLRSGVHPDDVARLDEALLESRQNNRPLEVEFRLLDVNKVYHWIHARSFASKHPQGLVWQGILLDVTHQRQLASSLHESEVKFQEIVEHCHDGILAVNRPNGVVVEANSAAALALRIDRDSLIGKSICVLVPELKGSIESESGEAVELKANYRPAAADVRDLEVRIKSMEFGGRKAAVIVMRDVTVRERLARERARIETEMARTQKLEGLGVMAGGIAHDFNNILVGILGNLSLAQRQIDSQSTAYETLKLVQRSAGRAADLTSKLLAYSGGSAVERVPFDLRKLLLSSRDHLEVAAGRRSTLTITSPPEQVVVLGDAVQIEQVVVNLVRNATEAITHDNGKIEVSLQTIVLDGSRPQGLIGSDVPPPAEYAKLSVKDNGTGISPEVLQKMFEPFMTTKFAGRGLGLSASLGIVRAHGGYLRIETAIGTGTEFVVLLPMAARLGDRVVEPKSARLETSNQLRRTVLVVDDEHLVRVTLSAMLRSISASTIEAESGDAALELLRAGMQPDCVLLDMTMPGKDGLKTLQEIRTILPELPVILCSGFTQLALTPQVAADKKVSFLAKPYTVDDLAAEIERITSKVPSKPVSA